jgi:uncharacterized membrane protein
VNRGLLVALVVAVLVGGAGVATAQPAAVQENIDPDDVVLAVAVDEQGDAALLVEYRVRLDDNESESAFESYREDLESNTSTYTERFHNRMNATAEDASAATGRGMSIRNVSVVAHRESLPQQYGVVTYTFEWTNFAAVNGDRLIVGDAVDGLFLDEATTLLVQWPEGYVLADASPTPDASRQQSATWRGPVDFASGEPRLTLAPAESVGTGGGTEESTVPLAGALLLVLAVLGAALAAASREPWPFGGAADDEAAVDPTDGALLSNDEQVMALIEQNGGRMKQADVAEELGWTAAKTSQVTKRLREEGQLEAFRLGRENVLELPDEDST